MKYKALVAASFAALLLYVAVFAQSATIGTVNANANLRAGPGTSYAIAGTAGQGIAVTIVGKNEDNTWYHLDNGQWIAAFLVNTATDTPVLASTVAPTLPLTVTVIHDANLRQGPGTDFAISGGIPAGQTLEIIGQNTEMSWYQLADRSWIAAFLVDSTNVNTQAIATPQAPPTPVPTFTPTPVQPVYVPAPDPANNSGGSTCNDGSHSNSTGRGTCSHHGGVRH